MKTKEMEIACFIFGVNYYYNNGVFRASANFGGNSGVGAVDRQGGDP
jgi:hypothetical protein